MEPINYDAMSLEELREVASEAFGRVSDIETEQRRKQAEVLVGRCFRTRNNYSMPESEEDYWWLYVGVLDTKNILKFQVCSMGRVEINHEEGMVGWVEPYSEKRGYKEISREEFDQAFAETLMAAENLRMTTPTTAEEK